jgi:hypothetical protein
MKVEKKQDSVLGEAMDYGEKVPGSIRASTTKCAQLERVGFSPCEKMRICGSFVDYLIFFGPICLEQKTNHVVQVHVYY